MRGIKTESVRPREETNREKQGGRRNKRRRGRKGR